ASRHKQRHEKREALDVVPMRVAEQDGAANRLGGIGHEVEAKRTRARAAVEQKALTGVRDQLGARGIAAISQSGWARRCNRTACTPETNAHQVSFCGWRGSDRTQRPKSSKASWMAST